jgi:hypothetical protein
VKKRYLARQSGGFILNFRPEWNRAEGLPFRAQSGGQDVFKSAKHFQYFCVISAKKSDKAEDLILFVFAGKYLRVYATSNTRLVVPIVLGPIMRSVATRPATSSLIEFANLLSVFENNT